MNLSTIKMRILDMEETLKLSYKYPWLAKFNDITLLTLFNTDVEVWRRELIRKWAKDCQRYHELNKIENRS